MLGGLITESTKAALRCIRTLWPTMMRWWLRRHPEWAERRFRGLREGLNGLREQATFGDVREAHRTAIAWALASLDIWPQGIRGERSEGMIEAEADYLHRCTGSKLGLEVAKRKFPKDGPQEWRCRTDSQGEFMGDEYRQDLLGQHYEELVRRGKG